MESLLRSIDRQPDGLSIEQIINSAADGDIIKVVFKKEVSEQAVQDDSKEEAAKKVSSTALRSGREYLIKVKSWMTKPTVDDSFDFMEHWNNNIPMPFRVMKGKVLKETRGMVYMSLRACPVKTSTCIRCGRLLTHPVSMLYGLGPECGQHAYINPFDTEEELCAHYDELVNSLEKITWSGWIAKSGIEYATEVR